jgi:hypothetical protein
MAKMAAGSLFTTPPRGWRRVLSAGVAGSMILLMLGGVARFPDAPLRECPSGYCGKRNGSYTPEDYRLFNLWTTVLVIYWPLGVLVLGCLAWRADKRGDNGS